MRNVALVIFILFLLTLVIAGTGNNEQSKEQLAPIETVEEIHSTLIFSSSNEVFEKTIPNSHLKVAS